MGVRVGYANARPLGATALTQPIPAVCVGSPDQPAAFSIGSYIIGFSFRASRFRSM
jgi:hypothetical protein